MAERKSEAWLTSAWDDDSVANAMVLAGSLRRTKTTRTLAVISANTVAPEKRLALRKAFDGVFCLDDYWTPKNDANNNVEEIQAKIYAFSLSFFEKCVYVSPSSLVLENVDYLFEDKAAFKSLRNKEDGSIDLSFYMFQPRQKVWECLSACASKHGNHVSERLLSTWLSNQSAAMKIGQIPDDTIAKFSAKSGILMTDKTHAPILQLVVEVKNGLKLFERIKLLKNNKGIGLREKLIAATWLEIFDQQVSPILDSPMTAPSLMSIDHAQAIDKEGDDDDKYVNEPIAIIGMSCRYPGANTVEEFWNMLYEGGEGVREPPAYRWTKEHSIRVSQQERKTNAGFLSTKVDEFDARFFGVSPKEAAYMDPQTRILHEVLWEALEDSGIDPLSLYGTHTGIFTGSWMNDYKDIVQSSTERDFFRTYMGNSIGAAAARLSFLLGLTGPSIATESGCSSAIVALDLAVKSLRSGETKLAMAGGVNLLLHPFTSNIMDYVIAPDGRCKTFDANADGFGRAEGCGVLVLKRLSDAMRDRDNIWAVIRGSAVSQEGLSRSLGTPTVHCEALSMQLALKDANVSPERVSFVETHGTGTSVGDPMEVAAITKAYFSNSRTSPLVIGSVKTNVGHTESCSGITGIMKTILALQHELIPKHRNLDSLNPEIFLDSIPAMIPMEPVPWPKVKGKPRIAGVSSFGITGTDGHVIIQEAPDYELPQFMLGQERPKHLLKISGKSAEALDELLLKYENLFSERAENNKDGLFSDAAYSANVGRASFNHRAFVIAQDYQDAAQKLQEKKYVQGEVKDGENQQICFLFTGQGSQYEGMAKSLYDNSPIFRIHFDTCDRTLKEMYNLSIREILWGSEASSKELSRTIYSQTSIFCVEYCLLRLWQSWGIQPDFVLGHSLGEFCAAVAAGILEFQDALKLVAERSWLIDNLPRGSMLVIKASKTEVEKFMTSAGISLDFAAVNNPEQTVVAGDTDKVQSLLSYLKEQDVKAVILGASHAFHSRHMDPMLNKYREIAETIDYKEGNGRVQYISGMEGRLVEDSSDLGADYWVRHTREKVSFIDACAALREAGCVNFLEVGPQPVLSSFVMMNNEDVQLNCMPSLRRGQDDWETILTSLGKLYLKGYQVDWKAYDEPYTRNKVSLPFHPFHKKPFWVECTNSNVTLIHPLIGYAMNNASALNIFQNDLTVKSVPYVKDHCIGSRIVFPGAGFTEMCLSAGYCVANGLTDCLEVPRRAMRLENVRIEAPLELKEEKSCRLQVLVDLPESTGDGQQNSQGFRVKVFHQKTSDSETEGKWVLHATSTFAPVASTKDCMKKWNPDRIAEIMSTAESFTPETFYKRVDDAGLRFGEKFRMIKKYWAVKQTDTTNEVDEIVTEMAIPVDFNKYLLHPLIIDAVFQSGILTKYRYQDSKLKVPVTIGQITMFTGVEQEAGKETPGSLYLHAWYENGNYFVFIATENYTPIALVEDVELLDTNVKTIESVLEQQTSSIPDAWEEVWKVIPSPFSTAVKLVEIEPTFADPEVQEKLRILNATPKETVLVYHEIKKLLYLYIVNAFLELGWNPTLDQVVIPKAMCEELKILPEFQKLVRFYFTVLEDEGILRKNGTSSDFESWTVCSLLPAHEKVISDMTSLTSTLKSSKAAATIGIYENISKCLSKLLVGEESALTLLFPTEEDKQQFSADSYYQNHPARYDVITTAGVVCSSIYEQCQAVNDPNKVYRLLEVGSGTGSLSQHLFEWLEAVWGDRFELYYTDISQSFFLKAEKKFEKYSKNVKYSLFNLEQSPLGQGIPLNYFDMVCATDVLHATRKLEECLVHIRQTLRPGGALVFTETIIPARDITFVFGLLEGYWRYQDFEWREHHCCVSDEVWGNVLRRCGFESVHSSRMHVDQFSCVTAIASPTVKVDSLCASCTADNEEPKKEWVVFAEASNFEEVTAQVVNMLDVSGNKVTCVLRTNDKVDENLLKISVTIKTIRADDEDPSAIKSLVEKDGVHGIVFLWTMDFNENDQRKISLPFLHIAKLLVGMRKPPQFFAFTKGVHAINEDTITCHPTPATILGMIKALKNESYNLLLRYVDLDQDMSPAQQVDQMLFELAMNRGQREQQRVQVAYRGNVRFEPRFFKASIQRNDDVLKLPPSTDRYHLVLPKSRVIQDLEFDTLEEEVIGDEEVEIKIKTFALNFKDILTILKPSAEFEKLNTVGLDFAGIVTKAGASAKFACGDRVFGANFKETQLPSHLVLDSRSILKIPDSMTFWEAATLPAVFSTAYHCLVNIAKMKQGDTVLIHTGSGGVGLAAIQVAKHVGATIITTAGNVRKRAYLRSLGIEHVFQSRNTSFEKDILRATNGRGVDVVLNSITGPGIKEATLASTAKNARFVEMSKLNTWTVEEVKAMRPDVDYTIVDLTVLEREAWDKLLDRMKEFLAEGHLRPIPYVKFDALNIRQALQYFQKAKHIGKVVCAMPEVTKQAGQYKVSVPLFNSESTYLITGGLGGIGFEVCKWMLGLGATDIMLTGRSPPKPEVAAQIQELNDKGANVMVMLGDIGDLAHCKAMIKEIELNHKPLRGVMHCAGVLRDNLFPNQTWESFQATYTPKVNGTWNLHEVTRNIALEHFVLYSSVTALAGTPGQPNHAAANCFEDAFIHYRHSLGLPGTTINWGQWAQVGCAKEISISGVLLISVKRMLNGLEMVLKTNKRQICFSEFESFNNFGLLCPIVKGYIDDRLWKQHSNGMQSSQSVKAEQFWKDMDEAETKKEKEAVFGGYLKIILRAALRLEADEAINDDANIQELGVDSLMMIELKNSIQSLLGSRVNVTANMLKNCNTVRLISNAVVGKLVEDDEDGGVSLEPLSPEELTQLLAKDCVLDESIQVSTSSCLPAKTPSQIETVLVTGVTGQLGPYIISQLMKSYTSVKKIICLVRGAGDDTTTVTEKLKTTFNSMSLLADLDMTKLEILSGDVALENLGISQEKYTDLCSSVDAVIHCAWKMHHTEHYRPSENKRHSDIRSVNVTGLLNILRFSTSSKVKHVFYPSFLVCGVYEENDEGTLSDDWPKKASLDNIVADKLPGVFISKFVSELLLEQANERGIPCKVFRFPWIAGESGTGRLNFLNNLYILRFLSFLMVNAMPSLPIPANLLPVNICAELSLQLFFSDTIPSEIYNLVHPHPQVEQEFVQVAKDEFGKELKIVDWKEFAQLVQEHDSQVEELKGLFKDQKQLSMYMGDAVGYVKGYLASPDTFFGNRKMSTCISNYYQDFPSSMDTVRRDLRYLKSVGFLEKFGIK